MIHKFVNLDKSKPVLFTNLCIILKNLTDINRKFTKNTCFYVFIELRGFPY